MNSALKKMHQKLFSKDTGIFILKDPVCRDEMYFAPKFNDLMLMNGHYIYYEKNPEMQNYMISSRKKIGVTPSEVVADRAAKSFRDLVQTKMVMQERYKISKLACGAGMILILVLLIAGISVFNNYDRMKAVQMAMEAMSDTVQAKDVEEKKSGDRPKEEKNEKLNELDSREKLEKEYEQIKKEEETQESNQAIPKSSTGSYQISTIRKRLAKYYYASE